MKTAAITLFAVLATMLIPIGASAKGDLTKPFSVAQKAPETYKVKMDTSKGSFVIEVTRAWAPNGADRFYSLVKAGFYTDVRFFRVIKHFMAQFGIHGNPAVSKAWRNAQIADDPVVKSNDRGYVHILGHYFLRPDRRQFVRYARLLIRLDYRESRTAP